MGYTLYRVGNGMSEVVHRINAPLVARAVVRNVRNAVNYGVAHVDIGRSHIYFSP